MDKPLEKIGPYTIDGELGRGGMGVVYRATDSRLGRLVAIKSLHDEVLTSPEGLRRFEREARALAALNHPNIAGIHGLEQDGDQRFLILEFVDGETLAERLRRHRLPVAEALEIGTQIAAGLEAAHGAGIVHRDLKPANIKITPDGQVKVLDFGLAQMALPIPTVQSSDETLTLAIDDPVTKAGTLVGTVPYMSPEQACGRMVDKRSDIWSWAVMVHECLTGANPFAGPTPSDTIAAILAADIDLATLPAASPPLVLALLRGCLQRDVRDRLRDAGDLRLLLEGCRTELPTEAEVEQERVVVVDKTFLIDDEACRTLDKESLDPHLIGWQMQYADNERPSEVLQVWIPSFGEDHSMGIWRDLLSSSPYRTIVATPVGLEPKVTCRPVISMTNQLILLRRLVASVAAQARSSKVVVGGFSCGADMALRCAADDDTGEVFDGVLAMDPNLEKATCYLTGMFSRLDPDNSGDLMDILRQVGGGCQSPEEWILVHEHVVNCVDKLRSDLTSLVRQCQDIAGPFDTVQPEELSPFIRWFRKASEHTNKVRCVFSDDPQKRDMIARVRLDHLENECLGHGFTDDAFAFVPGLRHLDLMRSEAFWQHLEDFMDAV